MRPVYQTTYMVGRDGADTDGEVGDCLRACVASILELPLDEVPHFSADPEWYAWWRHMRRWARERGQDFSFSKSVEGLPPGVEYAITDWPGPGPGLMHAVVADRTGTVVHNPDPRGFWMHGVEPDGFIYVCDPYDPEPDDPDYVAYLLDQEEAA